MRISLGDVALWFDVSGPSAIAQGDTTAERPVLVTVHGGPGLDHIMLKSTLAPLAEDFQILYFDLRGHGRLPAQTTRLVRLPGARHTIFRDRPDLAFPAVRDFVAQNTASA